MCKQVKFRDFDDVVRGGIYDVDNEIIICACCGGIVELNEVEIIEVYEDWVDFTQSIID